MKVFPERKPDFGLAGEVEAIRPRDKTDGTLVDVGIDRFPVHGCPFAGQVNWSQLGETRCWRLRRSASYLGHKLLLLRPDGYR
jgi:hypothetical protein